MRQGMVLKQKPQECTGKKRNEQGILQRWQPVSKKEKSSKGDDICHSGILYSLGFDLSAFFQESLRSGIKGGRMAGQIPAPHPDHPGTLQTERESHRSATEKG